MTELCLNQGVLTRREKIERLLDQRGDTPSAFAGRMGFNRQSFFNWLDGSKPQKASVWPTIANELGVDTAVLLDDSRDLPPLSAPMYPTAEGEVEMPHWPSLPANEKWDMDPQECMRYIPVPSFVARKSPKDPERIAAYIQGRSMEPRLFEGDLVIIELGKATRTGRIALARSDEGRTLKVLRRSGMDLELHSINPDHGQARAAKWEVEGYLIAILRDYEKGTRGIIEWDWDGLGA